MARVFLTVTQEEIDAKVAENIRSRELELLSYDFEHDHHVRALDGLSHLKFDDQTQKYKGLHRDAMIAKAKSDGLDSAAIQNIADLNAIEFHENNLEAVKAERAKSERAYQSLLSTLPEGPRRDTAFAAAKAKEDKQKELG